MSKGLEVTDQDMFLSRSGMYEQAEIRGVDTSNPAIVDLLEHLIAVQACYIAHIRVLTITLHQRLGAD